MRFELSIVGSFGTDSPLDADIKSRLMEEVGAWPGFTRKYIISPRTDLLFSTQASLGLAYSRQLRTLLTAVSHMWQVFNVLPVRPDDEAAYLAHHKAEAEKRLTIDR